MKKNISDILLIAFVVRLVLLLINTYLFTLPQGGGDARGFEINIYYLAISYSDIDISSYFDNGVRFYLLLMSPIYYIFGRQPLILGLAMVLQGVYLVHLSYKASLYLWQNYQIARKTAWFIALFPLLMVESALVLRELPIMIFLMLGIISFIKFWKYNKRSSIFGFIIYTFIASLFHSGVIFMLVGFLFFINFNSKKSNFLTKIFSIVLVIGTLYMMNETGIGTNKLGGSFDKSLELLQKREHFHTVGGSRYPEWMRLSGEVSDFAKIPVRFVTFLFSPLIPWLVRSLWHTVGLIDAFLYLLMFYQIIKYRKIFKYNETAKAIFVMVLFTALVYSLGVTNVGTAIRHRAKLAPILIVLASGMNREQLKLYQQQYLELLKKYKKSRK